MPSGKHWTNFIFINLAFMFYIIGIYYLSSVQKIRANWSLYRCNPMYMPLSDNIDQDFIYCIQNIQTNFMGYLLQPLTNITGVMGGLMGGFIGELNGKQSYDLNYNNARLDGTLLSAFKNNPYTQSLTSVE